MNEKAIVDGVLAALKETDVWKWCEAQMQQSGGHGFDSAVMGNEDDEGFDPDAQYEDQLDDVLAGLDADESDLADEDFEDEQPLRTGRGQPRRYSRITDNEHSKIRQPYPTHQVHGLDVKDVSRKQWVSMDDTADAGSPPGRTTSPRSPDINANTHPRGTTESVYSRAKAAQRLAQELADKWVCREDVSQDSKQRAKLHLDGYTDDELEAEYAQH
jgi:hypothetical protein